MTALGRAGLIALLTLALTGSATARDRADLSAPKATGPQEVEVLSVVYDREALQPIVVLQGKRDKRNLALAIGPAEATGIAVPLQGLTPPRPLTHDLFLTLFGRLKVTLSRVVITDLRDNIYYATVFLTADGAELTLDARPSDAIALAIRAKAPVLVEDRVFDKGGHLPAPARPHI